MESQILYLINTIPDWREMIEQKGIRIKEQYPFAIFNYGPDVDPLDPIVREARGIIIDLNKNEVACWAFNRFYNSYEEAAQDDLDLFDWEHCRVEEKIDGSIVKAFWNEYTNEWQWATNSCIDASEATTFTGISFKKLIEMAGNYNQIIFESLDKNCTYIFELISPLQQIVIKYPTTMLYHIGTRNNHTGEEDWRYVGVMHPLSFRLSSLRDCLDAAQRLNQDDILNEGFVVVDRNWRRLKIKSPLYVAAHRLVANRTVTKEHIINVIKEESGTIDDLCKNYPSLGVYYRYYQYRMAELVNNVQIFIDYVRNLYEEYNHDRKAVALTIKKHPLSAFGFEAIGNDLAAEDLLKNVTKRRYLDLIPDYVPQNVLATIC